LVYWNPKSFLLPRNQSYCYPKRIYLHSQQSPCICHEMLFCSILYRKMSTKVFRSRNMVIISGNYLYLGVVNKIKLRNKNYIMRSLPYWELSRCITSHSMWSTPGILRRSLRIFHLSFLHQLPPRRFIQGLTCLLLPFS